jgi:hypothetical protein
LNHCVDSKKVDNWALGVLVHVLITNTFPFEDADPLNDLSGLDLSAIENNNARWLVEEVFLKFFKMLNFNYNKPYLAFKI